MLYYFFLFLVLLPQIPNVVLPVPNTHQSRTLIAHVLTCGVTERNVVDFNSTWFTPSGESIETIGTTRKAKGHLTAKNLNRIVGILNYISCLTLSNLSYKDDGVFVCSVSYTLVGSESVRTGNVTINFQLTGKYIRQN